MLSAKTGLKKEEGAQRYLNPLLHRALLVRLYNKYTEENCMTFRKFARKFKQKANEWEMIKESYFRRGKNKFHY